jgi:hypothetical protein
MSLEIIEYHNILERKLLENLNVNKINFILFNL